MLLSELFAKLSYGKLSNLSISGEGSGTIVEAKRPKIVEYLNDGLLRLYSRFLLKESYLVIEQVAHRQSYPLVLAHAYSNDASTEIDKFIQDSDENPFLGDVIKIFSCWNSAGEKIPLNDEHDPYSIFTPQPHIIQIPEPYAGDVIGVSYQARHPLVPVSLTAEINIPFTLESALASYIASCVYSDMNTQESTMKAQEHLRNYEGVCAEIEQNDLVNAAVVRSSDRFCKGGWI